MKEIGGKAIYGASVGILMLDAQFPRIVGDMGNALTWDFPVHYKIVRGASPDLVVRKQAKGLLDVFVQAALELEADGVDGITTNCGFLSLFQRDLAEAVSVPVVTSSLMQVNVVNSILPAGKRAGILTISGSTLTDKHLEAAGVELDTPIGSTENGSEFSRAILNNELELDVDLARKDNIEAALSMQAQYPNLGAIVLECTNMEPYARDIAWNTGLPVFSIQTFVRWLQNGLVPRKYGLK